MSVDSLHPEYNLALSRWELVRQIVNNAAQNLIRTVDVNDPSRSNQYKQDAILTNFTRLTKVGLTGLVFRKPMKVETPEDIEYIEDVATSTGFTLEQLSQKIIGEVLVTGRHGLLVDRPSNAVGAEITKIKQYNAETIINWKYREVEGITKLCMVVLREDIDVLGEDGFEWKQEVQFRVLLLDNNNQYIQLVFNEDNEIIKTFTPTDFNGRRFNEIPFAFIGSENNDAFIDPIPLYDLSVVNLGHYRNSADYEESIFITGQPYLVVNLGDVSTEEFEQANPGGVTFGSRSGLTVGMGGSASLLQASPNQLADTAMKRKEEQAASIGARLIAPPGGRETAEGARIRFSSQNSALFTITKNVDIAMTQVLFWISEFEMEIPATSVYMLNDQFYEDNIDPNVLAQQIMLFDKGLISGEEIRTNLKRSGVDLEDEFIIPSPIEILNNSPEDIEDDN